jgi:hypothetical protein
MFRMAVIAMTSLTVLASAHAPAFAFAGVDSCYKKCFIDSRGLSQGRKLACRRACVATPRYQCETRCWNANRDSTVRANACINTRC